MSVHGTTVHLGRMGSDIVTKLTVFVGFVAISLPITDSRTTIDWLSMRMNRLCVEVDASDKYHGYFLLEFAFANFERISQSQLQLSEMKHPNYSPIIAQVA